MLKMRSLSFCFDKLWLWNCQVKERESEWSHGLIGLLIHPLAFSLHEVKELSTTVHSAVGSTITTSRSIEWPVLGCRGRRRCKFFGGRVFPSPLPLPLPICHHKSLYENIFMLLIITVTQYWRDTLVRLVLRVNMEDAVVHWSLLVFSRLLFLFWSLSAVMWSRLAFQSCLLAITKKKKCSKGCSLVSSSLFPAVLVQRTHTLWIHLCCVIN